LPKYRIQIMDETGKELVRINDFTVRVLQEEKKEEKAQVYYYQPSWEQEALSESSISLKGPIWIFDDKGSLAQALQKKFSQEKIIHIQSDKTFRKMNASHYKMNKAKAEDYATLLKEEKQLPKTILYRHRAQGSPITLSDTDITKALDENYYSPFYLAKALIQQKLKEEVQLVFINETEENSSLLFTEG